MEKRKREVLTRDLRQHLNANRYGRLTAGQWLTMTADPVVTMLVLVTPAIIVLSWRLPVLLTRLWFVVLVVAVVLGVTMALRARRYARAPLQYYVLYAASAARNGWRFWRASSFYDDAGKVYRFGRWLTPRYPLVPDHAYMVYCLDDAQERVLCSALPLAHPDAEAFQPSAEFSRLQQQRTHAASSSS